MELSILCLVVCSELLTNINLILADQQALFTGIQGVSQVANVTRKNNTTTTACGVECLKQNCRGFNIHKIHGSCEHHTASEAQQQFTADEDSVYFCEYHITFHLNAISCIFWLFFRNISARFDAISHGFIIGCTSPATKSGDNSCENAYDGSLDTSFIVAQIGTGYYASTGWIELQLLVPIVVKGVKLANRCIPWVQTDQLRLTADSEVTEVCYF